MSQRLISLSADLSQLRNEGYDIEIRAGHLVVKNLPYVDSTRTVRHGVLVCALATDGTTTTQPPDHTALFAGDVPCNSRGEPLATIIAGSAPQKIDDTLTTQHTFSSKPSAGYPNYYEKISVYANQLSGHAEALDQNATPRPFLPVEATPEDGPFRYIDTASSRSGISAISAKLTLRRIAIVGLGGTGSYVLDLVAKTSVAEIHLFDGDQFSSHNAFRSPGAASIPELTARPSKVQYWKNKYDPFRNGIVPLQAFITEENVELLGGMDFVFLSLDRNKAKRIIVMWLEQKGIPFIDVGMGLIQVNDTITGLVRTTVSTAERPALERIPFSDDNLDEVYATNIQVADLNALNATLAVVRWKKVFGFYADLTKEIDSVYAIDGNYLTNVEP